MNASLIIKLIIILAILQILPFLMYGIDKMLSKTALTRIPEKMLLMTTFFFGILGSVAAMKIFRHKTSKPSFQYNFRKVVLLRIIALFSLGLLLWKYF